MVRNYFAGFIAFTALWILQPDADTYAALLFDGVLLNSGISGDYLAGAQEYEFGRHFWNGLYRYADGSFLAGGRPGELLRYCAKGRVIARYQLPEGGQLHGRICRAGDQLCFIISRRNRYTLVKLPVDAAPGSMAAEIPLAGIALQWNCHVCAEPLPTGEVLLAVNRDNDAPMAVAVNPTTGAARQIFVAEKMRFFGPLGFEGQFLYANYHADGRSWIGRIKLDGTPAAGGCWPVEQNWASMNGNVCLAGHSLFTLAYHGTVGRYTLNGEGAPGRLSKHNEMLGAPGQIIIDGDRIFAAASPNRCVLEGELRGEQLQWHRLIGGIAVNSLAVHSTNRLHFVWSAPGNQAYTFWGVVPADGECDTLPQATVGSIYECATGLALVEERVYLLGRANPLFGNTSPKPGGRIYCIVGDTRHFSAEPPANGFADPEGIASFAYPKERAFLFIADTGNHVVKRLPAFEGADNHSVPETLQMIEGNTLFTLEGPAGVAFDDAGNLYVAEKRRLSRFSRESALKYQRQWSVTGCGDVAFQRLASVCVAGNDLFVIDHEAHCLHRFRLNGEPVETYGRVGIAGNAPGEMNGPIAVAARGEFVYIADTGNSRVLRLRIRDNLPLVNLKPKT